MIGEIGRLREADIDAPDPEKVEGFKSLYWLTFTDPEGNKVNLLKGA